MTSTSQIAKLDTNGTIRVSTVKLIITIVLALIAIGGASTPAVLAMGKLVAHAGDASRHETPAQKEHRIDDRIELHLKPIEVQLGEILRRLDRSPDQ